MFLPNVAVLVLAIITLTDAVSFWPGAKQQPEMLTAQEEAELMELAYPEEKVGVMRRFMNALPCTRADDIEWEDDVAGKLKDGRPVCNHYFHRNHNPVFCSHYARRHYEPTSFRGVRRSVLFAKSKTDHLFEKALHKLDRGGHVVRRNRRLFALFPVGRRLQHRQRKREQLAYQQKQIQRQQALLVKQQRKLIEQQRTLNVLQAAPITIGAIEANAQKSPRAAAILAQIKANQAVTLLRKKAQAFYETLPENAKSKVRQLEMEAKNLPQTFKVALAPFTRQTAAAPARSPSQDSTAAILTPPSTSDQTTPKRVTMQQRRAAARRQLFNRPSKREF